MLGLLFGRHGGVTKGELTRMAQRSKLSDYMPYVSYDPKTRLYRNQDDTQGYIWECAPLVFAGEKTAATLNGLFKAGLPFGTVMQFILHADDYIDPILDGHRATVKRNDPIIVRSTDATCKFLQDGTAGVPQLNGIPIRNFRLFVTAKFPTYDAERMRGVNLAEIYTTITEILKGASLYPYPVDPPMLLDWLRRLMNDNPSVNNTAYDETIPIRKQVILDSVFERVSWHSLRMGQKILRALTPRIFPQEVNFFQTNQLIGGVWGITSDADQIRTPFICCTNIIFSNLKNKLRAKANLTLIKQASGSLALPLARRKEEFIWATDEVEKGTQFVQLMPIMWVYGKSDEAVTESLTRARRVWESQGYVMQEDKGILVPLFISSLPFGLYNIKRNLELLERDFITSPDATIHTLPIQADYAGGGKPVVLLAGRKGQLCGLDIYDKRAINNNCFIAASSGSGKSFFVNHVAYSYFKAGALIRIIDLGGSYRKLCNMLGGKYMDFTPESDICVNPFGTVVDIDDDCAVITAIVMQMIFSTTDSPPIDIAETANTLVKDAVLWAYQYAELDAGIDHVYHYLNTYPNEASDEQRNYAGASLAKRTEIAHMLAYNLREYTSGNRYGKWFNGRANFDISKDEFVVLELEHLKPQKELFKVVTLQILNAVTQDLYLSDRSRQRLIIFDEAWQFLTGDSSMMADVIESGYRRARKYGGSFSVVTQAISDLHQFGRAGTVIQNSSAYKFYLQAPNYDAIRASGLIEYDDFVMRLLKSTQSNRPKYSEIFMDTPFGIGVARLLVDDYSYYIYTSDAAETAEINQLMESGMTNDEAIQYMVRKYRS